MAKPSGCWKCEYCHSINRDLNICQLDAHVFKDRHGFFEKRDENCPLDKDEQKGAIDEDDN